MKLELEVTNCLDCPYKKFHEEHRNNYHFCTHPSFPAKSESILYGEFDTSFMQVPHWCPLELNPRDENKEIVMDEIKKIIKEKEVSE